MKSNGINFSNVLFLESLSFSALPVFCQALSWCLFMVIVTSAGYCERVGHLWPLCESEKSHGAMPNAWNLGL